MCTNICCKRPSSVSITSFDNQGLDAKWLYIKAAYPSTAVLLLVQDQQIVWEFRLCMHQNQWNCQSVLNIHCKSICPAKRYQTQLNPPVFPSKAFGFYIHIYSSYSFQKHQNLTKICSYVPIIQQSSANKGFQWKKAYEEEAITLGRGKMNA